MTMRLLEIALLLLGASWAAAYRLGRTWGSTRQERARRLPGDEIVPSPHFVTDHAIDIDAPPAAVWPWLLQVGWRRGGWYTYRWVDRLLFPDNAPSANQVLPELQHLAVGDTVPDGAPETGCFFVVERLEAARHLVLHSTTHLPPQLLHRPGVDLSWTWTFVLGELPDGRTRFHFRCRGHVQPFRLRVISQALIVPTDFVMGRSMCFGLKRRVERASAQAGAGALQQRTGGTG